MMPELAAAESTTGADNFAYWGIVLVRNVSIVFGPVYLYLHAACHGYNLEDQLQVRTSARCLGLGK